MKLMLERSCEEAAWRKREMPEEPHLVQDIAGAPEIMEQRRATPAVPCPNPWPTEPQSIINECFMSFSFEIICYTVIITGTMGLVGSLEVGKSTSFSSWVTWGIPGRCWKQQGSFTNAVRPCEFRTWNLVCFLIRVELELPRASSIKIEFTKANRNGNWARRSALVT